MDICIDMGCGMCEHKQGRKERRLDEGYIGLGVVVSEVSVNPMKSPRARMEFHNCPKSKAEIYVIYVCMYVCWGLSPGPRAC